MRCNNVLASAEESTTPCPSEILLPCNETESPCTPTSVVQCDDGSCAVKKSLCPGEGCSKHFPRVAIISIEICLNQKKTQKTRNY